MTIKLTLSRPQIKRVMLGEPVHISYVNLLYSQVDPNAVELDLDTVSMKKIASALKRHKGTTLHITEKEARSTMELEKSKIVKGGGGLLGDVMGMFGGSIAGDLGKLAKRGAIGATHIALKPLKTLAELMIEEQGKKLGSQLMSTLTGQKGAGLYPPGY